MINTSADEGLIEIIERIKIREVEMKENNKREEKEVQKQNVTVSEAMMSHYTQERKRSHNGQEVPTRF